MEYLPALELTMRTEYAYKALEILAKYHPQLPKAAASVFGGVKWLQAIYPVYLHVGINFMPLSGIKIENVKEYLAEPSVFTCGGS